MIFSRFECRSRGNSQDPRSSASMRTLRNLDCGYATRCPYAPITPSSPLDAMRDVASEDHALRSWRARARTWTPHRGIVPSPFKIPVSGESMRFDATSPGGMESPVCEQPRPNFSLLREREKGMKLIPIEVYRAKFSTVCVSRSSII